ncbi:probable Dol-P-Man:Man(7)GlcNAc(2)-PP-Dol alpha-1,6-mannosyltransferase isoform X2 [Venturia canescens]|nr:probable Dol-P-Man:Man(7)GlcNAc(2)-PP-Dol alpha-1,6-mannosyltransferase isoform X2 [Venturia canescens]
MLLGLFLLYDIASKKLTVPRLLKIAVPAGIFFLAVTVTIDTIFWRRLLWPEGEVFYFNTVLNKSSQWGTSPFLWYFYSALPRGLALSYVLVPLGMLWDPRVRALTVPGLVFVLLFSFLPHKELRFIIYVFPLLNVSAAAVCHRIWENRGKSAWNSFLALCILGHLTLNAIFSMFLLCVAGSNYPGGLAIARLHRLERESNIPVSVHIDVLTAQTGVSRFTQTNSKWTYSKQENLTFDDPEILKFTHLLMEAKSRYSPNIKPYLKTHDILDSVDAFSHIALNYNFIPPIKIKTKPTIFIMKRKSNIIYDPAKAALSEEPPKEDFYEDEEIEIPSEPPAKAATIKPTPVIRIESTEKMKKAVRSAEETARIRIELQSPPPLNDPGLDSLEELEELIDEISVDFFDSSYETTEQMSNELLDENKEKIIETSEADELLRETERLLKERRKSEPQVLELKIEKRMKKASKPDVTPSPQLVKKNETPTIESHREGSGGVKEAVKKMIQEKMQEVKVKQILNGNPEIPTVPPNRVPKMQLKVKSEKPEVSRKPKIVVNKELVDEEERTVLANERKGNEEKVTRVKESIRNIISQFREFEKDLIEDDPITMREWNEVEDESRESEIGAASIEENISEMDKFIVENQDPQVLNDAKSNLKEIIEQFKVLKSEFTSDEDDQFDEIARRFEERPISETLVHFSDALKSLVQRRKDKIKTLAVDEIYGDEKSAAKASNLPTRNPNLVKKIRSKLSAKEPKILKIENNGNRGRMENMRDNVVQENFSEGTSSHARKDAASTNI